MLPPASSSAPQSRPSGRGSPDEGCIEIDVDGHVASVDRTAEDLLGWSGQDLAGKPLLALTGARSGRALAHGSMLLNALRSGRKLRIDDAELIRKDRSMLPVTCVASPRYTDGTPSGTVLRFRAAGAEYPVAPPHSAAAIPALDRVAFESRLAEAVRTANRDLAPLAVLMLRLEQRDEAGAPARAGEAAWQEAAGRIRRLLRAGDSVARVSVDQLAVLMPGVDSTSASRTAWAVVTALGRPLAAAEPTPIVNAGLALYPRDSGDTLLLNAEAALTAARHRGSGVAVYGSRTPDSVGVMAGMRLQLA
ncbi:MAG: GGDEF domain-containing protein [Dehalococcoidia bacterium]